MAGDEDQEVETATNSTPEELERERLRKKVELGVEKCNLTDTEARVYSRRGGTWPLTKILIKNVLMRIFQ